MTRREIPSRADHFPSRRAFTQIELLVVIAVLSLLVAVSLPAMQGVRMRARRLECVNRQRQLALALTSAAERLGRYPAAGYFEASGSKQYHSWAVTILPELGAGEVHARYNFQLDHRSPHNREVARTNMPLLTCPTDPSLVAGEGNLSYVVNGGMAWTVPIDCPSVLRWEGNRLKITPIDFNGNGVVCPFDEATDGAENDISYLKRLSVFFIENWPDGSGTVRFSRPGEVGDGTSHTLLLSENVRAGYDPRIKNSWADPVPLRNMFFVSSQICPNRNCQTGVKLTLANERTAEPARRESLNSSLKQPEGAAPWPSSQHGALVNFAFCDGHVRSISESIDGEVYFSMVTPRGFTKEHPLSEPLPSDFD